MIKFAFFPLLSLVSGTPLPLAIVESCSMYHQGDIFSNFNAWWGRHYVKYTSLNMTESEFMNFPFHNGFDKGDILFITGVSPQNVKIGDVIIFNVNGESSPIIHRVINITVQNGTYVFSTEGDNNNGQLSFEKYIIGSGSGNQVIGKAAFKVAPFIGWIKLIMFQWQLPSYERGLCYETPT